MKNKVLQLLILFCFACFGVARATNIYIGDWESPQSSGQLPLNTVRNYSLTQQIYTHNEIGMPGTITSISFNNLSNSSFSFSNIRMFMKAVNKEVFITTTDMVPVSASDKVFEGTFSVSENGWATIYLDTPFEYDGQSNLLVCFYDPNPGIDARPQFQNTATTRNLSLAYYSDTEIPELNQYGYQGFKSRYKIRNNIRLNITPFDNQQLTVYEGNSTSLYVPAYVFYFDQYSRSHNVYTDYWPYGSATTNLYDETGEAGWSYNAISNGGNLEHLGWRTLKRSEWTYVLTQRTTASGIRYAKAVVNDVNGLLLLPDDWDASNYSLNFTNTTGASFTSNTISALQWSVLEQFGVVFLPATGWRSGTNLNAAGEYGSYWASQEGNASNAGCINFSNTYFGSGDTTPRYYGTGVRLVFPAK